VRLDFAASTDVGRVRKDNQDSGYAGPYLLAICDGVGGAARGDLASSTAIGQLRKLDRAPDEDLLGLVAGALHRAHDAIADLVEEEPALNGTSTTASIGLFDGQRLGLGHVGDSRGYLMRGGELRQITHDHTFVQTLIDEGRISEEESHTHPHRNLILQAVDGFSNLEPDLEIIELELGDRLLFCSDGASGFLSLEQLADYLSGGSVDFAAVELVRRSLDAGSTDNVTCVVAEVVEGEPEGADTEPLVVGAAADLRRRAPRGVKELFRGHRSGDTGELEPVAADLAADLPEGARGAIVGDPIDEETARYAPREPQRHPTARLLLWALVVAGLVWIAGASAYHWTQQQYYVGEDDGTVTIFRGINANVPGLSLSDPYETTDVPMDSLSDYDRGKVDEGIDATDLQAAHDIVDNLNQEPTG
jgi:serine/threonine protein phosphatase PrpC